MSDKIDRSSHMIGWMRASGLDAFDPAMVAVAEDQARAKGYPVDRWRVEFEVVSEWVSELARRSHESWSAYVRCMPSATWVSLRRLGPRLTRSLGTVEIVSDSDRGPMVGCGMRSAATPHAAGFVRRCLLARPSTCS